MTTSVLAALLFTAARGAAAPPSAARERLIKARRIDAAHAEPLAPGSPNRLLIGDDWGCARVARQWDFHWECWDSDASRAALRSPPADATLPARTVPWLFGADFLATPDRLCGLAAGETRCWRWPDFARRRPRDLPDPGDDNDTQAGFSDGSLWLAAGGPLRCARTPDETGAWVCAGSESFGPQIASVADGGAALGDILHGDELVFGDWHGCDSGGDTVRCWGRNDLGQLGRASDETCRIDGHDVACSRTPRAPDFAIDRGAGIFATSTFTCYKFGEVRCWGASRDGLFGRAEDCPSGLRDAFPTPRGPVVAPHATCSRTPALATGFDPHQPPFNLRIGPRGMCGMPGDRGLRCNGAIPTPVFTDQHQYLVAVSPGERASACVASAPGLPGTRGALAQVHCWGQGYTSDGGAGADVPTVRIVFDERPHASAVIDRPKPPAAAPPSFPPSVSRTAHGTPLPPPAPSREPTWPANCAIHFSCPRAPRTLPACAAATAAAATPVATWVARAASRPAGRITVRGPLLVRSDPEARDERLEGERCHLVDPAPIVLGASAAASIRLDGLVCRGDQSRRCCTIPAYGQTVVARGQPERDGGSWVLRGPDLCVAR